MNVRKVATAIVIVGMAVLFPTGAYSAYWAVASYQAGASLPAFMFGITAVVCAAGFLHGTRGLAEAYL